MNKLQRGFTLLELMIVVAIIGILAAIAIPAYRDYMVRSKVSECATALGACKTSVTEVWNNSGTWPADLNAAGCSNVATHFCNDMNVATNAITINVNASGVGLTGSDCALNLVAEISGNDITAWSGNTGCDKKYVPVTFRN